MLLWKTSWFWRYFPFCCSHIIVWLTGEHRDDLSFLFQGPCPNCGNENLSFFGTILSVPSGGAKNSVKCAKYALQLLVSSSVWFRPCILISVYCYAVHQLWHWVGVRFGIPVDYTPRTSRGISKGGLGESLSHQPAVIKGRPKVPC